MNISGDKYEVKTRIMQFSSASRSKILGSHGGFL